MVAYANRCVTLAIAILFIISTSHLIIHEPDFASKASPRLARHTQSASHQDMLRKRALPREATTDVRNKTGNGSAFNYVIFDASQFMESLAFLNEKQAGWRVLVINLRNLSQLITCRVCFLLKDEWIKSNVVDQWWSAHGQPDPGMDSNGLAKMAAYAYVLSQGAPWIYVTDRPLPVPYRALMKAAHHGVKTGLVYQGPKSVFEPCDHFMDPFTWRGRGFHKDQGRYNVKVVPSHSVYYVVSDCFRNGMGKRDTKNPLDTKAPPAYIMPGTFAAIDFNNVLVSNPNVWALVASVFTRSVDNPLPSAKAVQVNLMVQRVLWDTDGTVGFLSDTSIAGHQGQDTSRAGHWIQDTSSAGHQGQDTSSAGHQGQDTSRARHQCPTCDLQTRLDNIGDDLLTNLTRWRCDFFEPVPTCLVRLSEQAFLPDKELQHLVAVWMSLLESYAWKPRDRLVFSDDTLVQRFTGIPVYFTPAKSLQNKPVNNTRPPNPFYNVCAEEKKPYLAKIPHRHSFEDIVLIIVFNFGSLVSYIPLLDYVYGRFFKYIVYCSESATQFERRYQTHFNANPVTFVEIRHKNGYWGQGCMAATVKMGYDVTGFLQISDDLLLNAWNLDKLPYHKPWFQATMRVANVHHSLVPDVWINQFWWPWNQYFGRVAAVNVFKQLQAMVSHPQHGDRVVHFLEKLDNVTNCDECFLYEASDIFYLPRHLADDFTFFSDIFSYHKVFLEISIPTILVGITSDADVYRLRGNYLWFQDREKYPFVYTEYDHFYHALKFSQLGIKKHLNFYCHAFLGRLDSEIQT